MRRRSETAAAAAADTSATLATMTATADAYSSVSLFDQPSDPLTHRWAVLRNVVYDTHQCRFLLFAPPGVQYPAILARSRLGLEGPRGVTVQGTRPAWMCSGEGKKEGGREEGGEGLSDDNRRPHVAWLLVSYSNNMFHLLVDTLVSAFAAVIDPRSRHHRSSRRHRSSSNSRSAPTIHREVVFAVRLHNNSEARAALFLDPASREHILLTAVLGKAAWLKNDMSTAAGAQPHTSTNTTGGAPTTRTVPPPSSALSSTFCIDRGGRHDGAHSSLRHHLGDCTATVLLGERTHDDDQATAAERGRNGLICLERVTVGTEAINVIQPSIASFPTLPLSVFEDTRYHGWAQAADADVRQWEMGLRRRILRDLQGRFNRFLAGKMLGIRPMGLMVGEVVGSSSGGGSSGGSGGSAGGLLTIIRRSGKRRVANVARLTVVAQEEVSRRHKEVSRRYHHYDNHPQQGTKTQTRTQTQPTLPRTHDEPTEPHTSSWAVEGHFLERLPFAEQVEVMRRSRVVVGVTGQGMANVVFCERGTSVVLLVPRHIWGARFNYVNLAVASGLNTWVYRPDGDGYSGGAAGMGGDTNAGGGGGGDTLSADGGLGDGATGATGATAHFCEGPDVAVGGGGGTYGEEEKPTVKEGGPAARHLPPPLSPPSTPPSTPSPPRSPSHLLSPPLRNPAPHTHPLEPEAGYPRRSSVGDEVPMSVNEVVFRAMIRRALVAAGVSRSASAGGGEEAGEDNGGRETDWEAGRKSGRGEGMSHARVFIAGLIPCTVIDNNEGERDDGGGERVRGEEALEGDAASGGSACKDEQCDT